MVAEWNGQPIRDLEDDHLVNAERKCRNLIVSCQNWIDECQSWQTQKLEELEERRDELECSLIGLQQEIKKRG